MTSIHFPEHLKPRKMKDALGFYSHRRNGSTVLAFGDNDDEGYFVGYWHIRDGAFDEHETFGTMRKLRLTRFHELFEKVDNPAGM